MNDLTEREKQILKIIVEQYNLKYEPISSQVVSQLFDKKISSQTIRNCMAVLEKKGYLIKTHASSGRIPAKIALDFFANNLNSFEIDEIIQNRLKSLFIKRDENIDNIINDSLMILNEITNLPSITNVSNENENLREVNLVQLNENSALLLIVTNLGNIYKNYLYIEKDSEINDIKTCIRLFNQNLIGVQINDLWNKINEINPIIKKEVKEYEYITREVISKFFNTTLKQINRTNFVGVTSLSQYPEFQDSQTFFKILDMIESGNIWQQIAHDMDESNAVKIEYKPIDDSDKNKVFMVATTEIKYDNVTRQISVVGPSRTDLNKIKGILNYFKIQIEKVLCNKEKTQ